MEEIASAVNSENSDIPLEAPVLEASQPYVGQWNRLISNTNWEKGRIICQWRTLIESNGGPPSAASDETWARLVGGVTGQHVGRLRRIFQRFGASYEQYQGLFWSHFFAASEWSDGEMWLEGAVQNKWSVSNMRQQRAHTLGEVVTEHPREADLSGVDEDVESSATSDAIKPELSGSYDEVQGPRHEGPDFGDDSSSESDAGDAMGEEFVSMPAAGSQVDLIRPFADLPELPSDLADAVDQLKLALLHHKTAGWTQISRDGALQVLDALKTLVMAPSSEDAAAEPF